MPLSKTVIFPFVMVMSALLMLLTFRSGPSARSQKPRYIFIDLGANRADSLEAFLQQPGSKFQFDYPRPSWARHEDAEIFLFEANPVFNADLVRAKEKYSAKGIKVNIFPSTVVDVEDGIRTFYLDTVNKDHDFWGSSMYAEHWDAKASGSKGTRLTGVNIASWMLRNFLPRDYVVIKMDIEGAEYEVVPHLAEMSAWVVMDELLIEWHGAGIGGGTPEEIEIRDRRASAAKRKLEDEGVLMPHYDTPSA